MLCERGLRRSERHKMKGRGRTRCELRCRWGVQLQKSEGRDEETIFQTKTDRSKMVERKGTATETKKKKTKRLS